MKIMSQDELLRTANVLVKELVSAKKQKANKAKSLLNKAKELGEKIDGFKSTHDLLNDI